MGKGLTMVQVDVDVVTRLENFNSKCCGCVFCAVCYLEHPNQAGTNNQTSLHLPPCLLLLTIVGSIYYCEPHPPNC